MIQTIRALLVKIIERIDGNNSNLSEEDSLKLVNILQEYTNPNIRVSKYEAYTKYLRVSRATFDRYVQEGKLPKGQHHIGFKELSWSKKDLDNFVKTYKNTN